MAARRRVVVPTTTPDERVIIGLVRSRGVDAPYGSKEKASNRKADRSWFIQRVKSNGNGRVQTHEGKLTFSRKLGDAWQLTD